MHNVNLHVCILYLYHFPKPDGFPLQAKNTHGITRGDFLCKLGSSMDNEMDCNGGFMPLLLEQYEYIKHSCRLWVAGLHLQTTAGNG